MPACTFFGHRDCPETVKPALRQAIETLIRSNGVDTFYVGNQGRFDAYVRSTLRQLQKEHPHIQYSVVLAYMPIQKKSEDDSDTVFPEGMELVHPKYAIDRRNRWMLQHADYVVCYLRRQWGGAARFVRSAAGQGKPVVNLFADENIPDA